MNYYPNNNFYQNYPYGNGIYQSQQVQPIANTLQGKVVDSVDMVKVNEVPFGGFGVFPKGDLSEIYIKSWNNNGTTQINTYKPVLQEENKENEPDASVNELLEKINSLNEKLDILMKNAANSAQASQAPISDLKPVPAKDVKVNAY